MQMISVSQFYCIKIDKQYTWIHCHNPHIRVTGRFHIQSSAYMSIVIYYDIMF